MSRNHVPARRWAATGAAALALALAASCSAKSGATSQQTGRDGVKMGPGVTDDSIALGELVDLTGPFAANDSKITNAHQAYFDNLNAQGGICGRKVNLVIKDTGYDVQRATTAYSDVSRNVLGYSQVFGSAINAALLTRYSQDGVLVYPASGSGPLLSSPNILGVGTTYDYEVVNVVDYWLSQGIIRPGATIAHLHIEGDYGETAADGAQYVAQQNNLHLASAQVNPTDTDLTAQITSLKQSNPAALLLSVSPKQAASAVVAAQAAGLNIPISVNGAGWNSGILQGASAAPAQQHLYVTQPWAVPSMDVPVVQNFVNLYKQRFPGSDPDSSVTLGLSSATVYGQILKTACANKDLTRSGLLAAEKQLTNVDTGGLLPPLDYTRQGQAATDKVLILRPDPAVAGGIRAVTDQPYEGKDAGAYRPPYVRTGG